MARPRHRRPYDEHPEILPAVVDLLGRVWPWFPAHEALAREHGLRWEAVSTPFVVTEDGRAFSHVGVLETPLVIDGRETAVGHVHAVATDPAHRRRGLYRAVMEEALAWCDERYETLLITTDQPVLYERFGFRVLPEARGVTDDPPPPGAAEPFRILDRTRADERAALHRLLAERAPVSARLGVVREIPVFLFDTARLDLWYAPRPETVVVAAWNGGTLRIHDVVAREMPTLPEIVARLDRPAGRIEVHFAADRLGGGLREEPWTDPDGEIVMARGPFPDDGRMLAVTARC